LMPVIFFFSSRRRHTRFSRDWSSDVCSSDLKGSNEQAALVRDAIRGGGLDHLEAVLAAIAATGALDYTLAMARDHVARALDALDTLPASTTRTALAEPARVAVARASYAPPHGRIAASDCGGISLCCRQFPL